MKIYGMDIRGKFWPQRLSANTTEPWTSEDEGRLLYDESLQALYFGDSSEWVKITAVGDLFNTGQKIIFASQPLPTGWNIDTSIGDKMISLTSIAGQVGNVGGTWSIGGLNNAGGHDHYPLAGGMGNPTQIMARGTSEIYAYGAWYLHQHSMIVDGAHSHSFDGLWRPANVQFIVGELG